MLLSDHAWPGRERYRQLPLEVVARHEAGHAVMAHRCGGWVKRIIFGRHASGENYGRCLWAVTDPEHYLLVLSGGVLALYLHERPSQKGFESFIDWVSTPDGYAMATSGVSDWVQILRRTQQTPGYGMEYFLERAVRPYFDEGIEQLAGGYDQVASLTEQLLARPPGMGRQSLKRFFAGRLPNRIAEWADRPWVIGSACLESARHRR